MSTRAIEHLMAADRILAEASDNSPRLTIKAVNAAWLEMNKARALLLDEAYQAAAARLRLRDAAPDLLAALIDAVAMLEVYTDPRGSRVNASTAGQARSTIRDARAAIAKAEG